MATVRTDDGRPNIVLILSDDHASHAISSYAAALGRPPINTTPHLDRIATGGVRFDACFCTNSICTPSRASILTGTYNHVNGVTTLETPMDNTLSTFPKVLQAAGYQTALFGKWHLGHGPAHDPTGFDEWRVLPGQGHYHDPAMLAPGGEVIERSGYVTDLITDDCIDWLDRRDRARPFLLCCHHKAPHRTWEPHPDHLTLFDDIDVPEPTTMFDDHATRAAVVRAMRMGLRDLRPTRDLKAPLPPGLSDDDEIRWRYQRYIKDYLRVIHSLDLNVGRLLDRLDDDGIADETVVIYTSDQGFFLGDHGWFDKRLMYEESLAMPFLVRYPPVTEPGSACADLALNVDVAPTLLELAGVDAPDDVQGLSLVPLLRGERPADWRTSMYYRYWMHRDGAHLVPAHYGVRTDRFKLICFYNDPLDQPGAHGPSQPVEWELYDLAADPLEMTNVIDDASLGGVVTELRGELARLQAELGDAPHQGALTD
jgi:arylsulfatase A-like enzyme